MRFMLLDTCHAANAFNPRLEKDAQDARIVVFSATAANNTAAELPELGHGVFTYSVLEGLRGKAKTSDDGVTLFGLADFISREVVRLTVVEAEAVLLCRRRGQHCAGRAVSASCRRLAGACVGWSSR